MFNKPLDDAYEKEQERKRQKLTMGPGFDGVNWITANDSAKRFKERMEKDAKEEKNETQ